MSLMCFVKVYNEKLRKEVGGLGKIERTGEVPLVVIGLQDTVLRFQPLVIGYKVCTHPHGQIEHS